MDRKIYLEELDRSLLFAAAHTDSAGRMVVDGEIDTKDSGWLVLGGVIRGREAHDHPDLANLGLYEYYAKYMGFIRSTDNSKKTEDESDWQALDEPSPFEYK